jgi:hypothetical protein
MRDRLPKHINNKMEIILMCQSLCIIPGGVLYQGFVYVTYDRTYQIDSYNLVSIKFLTFYINLTSITFLKTMEGYTIR